MAKLIRIGPSNMEATIGRHRCLKCDTRFEREALVNVPIHLWVAHAKMIRCPNCGNGPKKITLGECRRLDEDIEQRIDGSIEDRYRHWLADGETGLSSKAIGHFMMHGHGPGRKWDHPHDLDDFRRCMLLLGHVPEWRVRMPRMARCGAEWKRIAPLWEDIALAYERDCPNYQGSSQDAHRILRGEAA